MLVAFAAVAERLGLRWYVFGAQAVNLHGFPRTTADLDVTIDLGQLAISALVPALKRAGFEARFDDEAFIASTRVLPVVHRATGYPVDLVLAGPGLEQRFLDEVVVRTIAKTKVPVISLENLIVTKVLAGRPRDLEDVRELIAGGRVVDHVRVLELLGLIEEALGQSDLVPLYDRLRG